MLVLVFVSDPGLVSSFFHDELLASALQSLSVDRGRGAPRREEHCPMIKAKARPFSNIQHGFCQSNSIGFPCPS